MTHSPPLPPNEPSPWGPPPEGPRDEPSLWAPAPDAGPSDAPPWGPTPWGPPLSPPDWGTPAYGRPTGWGDSPYGPPPVWGDSPYGPRQDLPPAYRPEWMAFDVAKAPPRWGMPDILLAMIAFIVGSVLFAIPVVMATTATGPLNIASLVGSWIGVVGFLVLISRRKGQRTLRDDFGFRVQWIDPVIGVVTGFAAVIVAGIVITVVANLFEAAPGSNGDEVFSDKSSAAIVVITAIMASIGAPIVEELLFRGLALRSIDRRFGSTIAIIASSLLFGFLHWQGGTVGSTVSLVLGLSSVGFLFALVTRWTGRLGASTFAHMTFNSIASISQLYLYFSHGGWLLVR